MIIPEYGIEHRFTAGANVVEFTPEKAGVFRYSCWMGMIRSSITVLEGGGDAQAAKAAALAAEAAAAEDEFYFDESELEGFGDFEDMDDEDFWALFEAEFFSENSGEAPDGESEN
jgi:hypothetical protein